MKAVDVETWLGTIALANESKAKVRNIVSAIFTHAMRYEWLDRNPIALVRQSAKREKLPDVLTAEEIGALLRELPRIMPDSGTAGIVYGVAGVRTSGPEMG